MSSKIFRDKKDLQSIQFKQIPEIQNYSKRPDGSSQVADACQVEGGLSVEDAISKSQQIINEALQKAKIIEQEAYQAGYQDGLDKAYAELRDVMELIKSIAQSALEEKWKVIKNVEPDVVKLAIEIAEKVVAEQIKLSPDIVLNIAKKALMLTAEREHIQIRVNPQDTETIKSHKSDLMAYMDGIKEIEVIADRRVQPGGCILETAVGNVDGRIQSQLKQIEEAMQDVISNE